MWMLVQMLGGGALESCIGKGLCEVIMGFMDSWLKQCSAVGRLLVVDSEFWWIVFGLRCC